MAKELTLIRGFLLFMASASEFRRFLAESGRQSELDAIQREPGGFEKALAKFSAGGFRPTAAQTTQVDNRKLIEEQRGRTEAFLGRFRTGLTEASTAISQELGLPGLRETAFGAGQTARGVAQQVRDIPQAQQTIAKQVGISAPRLAQRTAAETAKLSPALETAQRGLIEATSAQQFGEEEFGRRIGQFLQPFEIEAGLLGESVAAEFGLFKDTVKNDLDRELAQLAAKTSITLADIQSASRLAEIEKASQSGTFTDLGNRVALINPITGEEIVSFNKGRAPSGPSGLGDWEGA